MYLILLIHTAQFFSHQHHDTIVPVCASPWLAVSQNIHGSHHIHLHYKARVIAVKMLELVRGNWTDLVMQNPEMAVVIFSLSWLPP